MPIPVEPGDRSCELLALSWTGWACDVISLVSSPPPKGLLSWGGGAIGPVLSCFYRKSCSRESEAVQVGAEALMASCFLPTTWPVPPAPQVAHLEGRS